MVENYPGMRQRSVGSSVMHVGNLVDQLGSSLCCQAGPQDDATRDAAANSPSFHVHRSQGRYWEGLTAKATGGLSFQATAPLAHFTLGWFPRIYASE